MRRRTAERGFVSICAALVLLIGPGLGSASDPGPVQHLPEGRVIRTGPKLPQQSIDGHVLDPAREASAGTAGSELDGGWLVASGAKDPVSVGHLGCPGCDLWRPWIFWAHWAAAPPWDRPHPVTVPYARP